MPLRHLLAKNSAWAEAMKKRDPHFFEILSHQQSPAYLWIGCSDSRVPANEIIGLLPGEVFVHRNIANVVCHTDLNCLSVLQYAVDVLKVRHVMVVGHYGCGGVRAAFAGQRLGLADNWIRHVQDVRAIHSACLCERAGDEAQMNLLCELNVIEQVSNVCQTTIVRDAWERGQTLMVHGWIYGLQNGLLRDLKVTATCIEEADLAYSQAVSSARAG